MFTALEPGGNYQGPCRTLFFISIILRSLFLAEHQFILDISSVNRVTLNLVSYISLTSVLFTSLFVPADPTGAHY